MPNFHENFLAIAANEEDMRKVLMRFAANLYAQRKEIGDADLFDQQTAGGRSTFQLGSCREEGLNLEKLVGMEIRDLYREVGSLIDLCYAYSFVGAPNPGKLEEMQVNWDFSVSTADEYMNQVITVFETLGNYASSVGPMGCGLSDTATVCLNRYGTNWVLTVRYCTAWAPNSEELDYFFLGLPAGDYGVAFYDADESDGWKTIHAFSGLHHGYEEMVIYGEMSESDNIDRDELRERREEYSSIAKSKITELSELARMAVACGWSEWGWDEEEGYDDEGWDDESSPHEQATPPNGDDEESVDFHESPQINWITPSTIDLKRIDKLIFRSLECFPWCCGAQQFTDAGTDAAEVMFPGDLVTVVSKWRCKGGECDVDVSVVNSEDVELCVLPGYIQLFGSWENDRHVPAIIACLLPYLRVSVQSLVPCSMRNRGADGPRLTLQLDLKVVDLDELMTSVHALLEKKPKDRALSSKGRE